MQKLEYLKDGFTHRIHTYWDLDTILIFLTPSKSYHHWKMVELWFESWNWFLCMYWCEKATGWILKHLGQIYLLIFSQMLQGLWTYFTLQMDNGQNLTAKATEEILKAKWNVIQRPEPDWGCDFSHWREYVPGTMLAEAVVIPTPFIWAGCKYPQTKAESPEHGVCFKPFVVVYIAKMMKIVSMFQYFWTWLYSLSHVCNAQYVYFPLIAMPKLTILHIFTCH